MSIAHCPYCDKDYDQDFDVEHEENHEEFRNDPGKWFREMTKVFDNKFMEAK